MSQPGYQTIKINILTIIWRSKGNQAMKFRQVIEYNLRNIVLQNSFRFFFKTQNVVKKLFRHPIRIEHISGSIFYSFIYFAFFCKFEDYWNWLKLRFRPRAFTSNKVFLKNKKRSGTSLPASFSAWFLNKNISRVKFFYLTKCQYLVAFTLWDLGNMCFVIFVNKIVT